MKPGVLSSSALHQTNLTLPDNHTFSTELQKKKQCKVKMEKKIHTAVNQGS